MYQQKDWILCRLSYAGQLPIGDQRWFEHPCFPLPYGIRLKDESRAKAPLVPPPYRGLLRPMRSLMLAFTGQAA